MNKAYERINWENYPSENTALNESNLNKMDAALNEVDNRVVAHETTKLDKATANSMVKDVDFNETTGIFTITFLNGVTKTLDTKLEKIATNFRYDYATQKLILTLIDGTTQEIDMSALITQYEFENSAYINWMVVNGKVKAEIIDGSITADKLQPNFLADVTLQANSAKTSEQNAKTSEENAKQSEINAKNYADSAEPVASTAQGLNPTLENSTHAPFITFKGKGATIQDGEPTPDNPVDIVGVGESGVLEVKTTGKNIFGGLPFAQALVDSGSTNVVLDTDAKTVTFSTIGNPYSVFDKFKDNTRYTFILNGTNTASDGYSNLCVRYTDGSLKVIYTTFAYVSDADKTIERLECSNVGGQQTLNYEQCGIFEGVITADEFEPYTETTASIPLSAPLYEGDYIRYNMDGTGEIYRKYRRFRPTTIRTIINTSSLSNVAAISLDDNFAFTQVTAKSNYLMPLLGGSLQTGYFSVANNAIGAYSDIIFKIDGLTTLAEYQAWLDEHSDLEFVYELTTPIIEPLTAEQIDEFEKLRTFDGTTHIMCEADSEAQYFYNSVSGKAVAMIANMLKK